MSKDIYVFAEQRDGNVSKVGIELIGKARELADITNQKVVTILLGFDVKAKAKMLIEYGADKTIVVDHPILEEYMTEPYAKAVCSILTNKQPEIVLFGATSIGRDLAPRVSARIHTGLTADCTKLEIDIETKLLLMTRPAFGGNIMATILCRDFRPQMATVRPGVMTALKRDGSRNGKIEEINIEFMDSDVNVEITQVIKSIKKSVDITEAKYIVSGGRGFGTADKFDVLRSLAEELGAEVAASRACVDNGWVNKNCQVGQTGKTVRPDLYMACGISGAIQHVTGMDGSELIIAINKNEAAPIFDVVDLGIVGDVNKIIPKLTEALKKHNAKHKNLKEANKV